MVYRKHLMQCCNVRRCSIIKKIASFNKILLSIQVFTYQVIYLDISLSLLND